MPKKLDVQQGTLALMILKTLEVLGPLHGYGIARRIEETSKQQLTLNYGTLYPALLKLEQEGFVTSEWGQSENNRRAKFYALTAAGKKQLAQEARAWHRTADPAPELVRVLPPQPELAGELWLLTHPDLRRTARVRAFMETVARGLRRQRPLLEGLVI